MDADPEEWDVECNEDMADNFLTVGGCYRYEHDEQKDPWGDAV